MKTLLLFIMLVIASRAYGESKCDKFLDVYKSHKAVKYKDVLYPGTGSCAGEFLFLDAVIKVKGAEKASKEQYQELFDEYTVKIKKDLCPGLEDAFKFSKNIDIMGVDLDNYPVFMVQLTKETCKKYKN